VVDNFKGEWEKILWQLARVVVGQTLGGEARTQRPMGARDFRHEGEGKDLIGDSQRILFKKKSYTSLVSISFRS